MLQGAHSEGPLEIRERWRNVNHETMKKRAKQKGRDVARGRERDMFARLSPFFSEDDPEGGGFHRPTLPQSGGIHALDAMFFSGQSRELSRRIQNYFHLDELYPGQCKDL